MIQQIEAKFNKVRQVRDQAKGGIEELVRSVKLLATAHKEYKEEYKILQEVLDILRAYAMLREQTLREKVDAIVTKGLQAIFPNENFKSKLNFEIKRGQATVEPKLITSIDGQELVTNIEKAESGGVANVVGFIYQLLVLSLRRPRRRQIIFADEPFKNLSRKYLEAAGEFIRMLADKLGIQIVLITHKPEFVNVADIAYRFTKENNETKIERITK